MWCWEGAVRKRRGIPMRASGDLLFPLLLVVGLYIILHGHLTPGGGFQGGVILAAAFFLPVLARPSQRISHAGLMALEAFAGAAFIIIGLLAMRHGGQFLQPLLDKGQLGALLSGGTLPLLYIAVGVKVGAELAGLLVRLGDAEADS
ncbi:MnhB domain-containing protein [Thiolapillus sp.]|uniref:MnhB domain-containing protein n=1 Tax=Thiolapillus sp. TaxID=2017437 RepID=UPI003AF4B082